MIVALPCIGTAVTLYPALKRQNEGAVLVTTAAPHVALYNWTFLLGQSLTPGINALLLGTLLYRSRLVPRIIP